MLSNVLPWDTVAKGYAETTMSVFEGYAKKALSVANITKNSKVIDVACGPGTLSLLASPLVKSITAVDFSTKMLALLNQTIVKHNVDNINTIHADGQQLPLTHDQFDIAFSMFGLMFFPNRTKGYQEIHRTLKPGGQVIISSWAPVEDSPSFEIAFGAMRAMQPEIPPPQTDLESLENPDFFAKELSNVGFKNIDIIPIIEQFPVESVDEFWQGLVKGAAPIAVLKDTLSREEWKTKEALALNYLYKVIKPTQKLDAKAWLATAYK